MLLIPLHLDAFYLPHGRSAITPLADFSRLPYTNGEQDLNPDIAPLSEEILSQPFQDRSLYLPPGTHLHWALPDGLTNGVHIRRDTDGRANPVNGVLVGQDLVFPFVPDRWLVTRSDSDGRQQWVVESNYLHPPAESPLDATSEATSPPAITYPYHDGTHPQPFRYLGRAVPWADWVEADGDGSNPDYLHTLTALGYGEPTFAAFYPNCYSVFGFHDAAGPPGDGGARQYEIIGWYSQWAQDCLRATPLADTLEAVRARQEATTNETAVFREALRQAYGWAIDDTIASMDNIDLLPDRSFFYARLALLPSVFSPENVVDKPVTVAIGNSSTEALSAFLAYTQEGKKTILEEQLEALHLLPTLEGQQLDVGPRFRNARHERSFTAVPAGTLWTLRPDGGEQQATQTTLPIALAHKLNMLNQRQGAYDRAQQEIESLRYQLFADWYKYMLSVYPPPDALDDYPDSDQIRDFVENRALPALRDKLAQTGELALAADGRPVLLTNNGDGVSPSTLAAALAAAIEQLRAALPEIQHVIVADVRDWPAFANLLAGGAADDSPQAPIWQALPSGAQTAIRQLVQQPNDPALQESVVRALNKATLASRRFSEKVLLATTTLPAEAQQLWQQRHRWEEGDIARLNRLLLEMLLAPLLARRPRYTLQRSPAPRYWQPADPVVLVAGETVQPSPRHGEDGRLRPDGLLATRLLPAGLSWPADAIPLIQEALAQQQDTNQPQIGFATADGAPWHPFLLEWEVEFFPVYEGSNLNPFSGTYYQDAITGNYLLRHEAVDFTFRPGSDQLASGACVYSGRSLLTPYATRQLQEQLAAYLEKTLLPRYYEAKNIPAGERGNDYFRQHQDAIVAWYQEPETEGETTTDAMLRIYDHISQPTFQPLAQALGGFHNALLMQKSTLQFPLIDPLGFADYRTFTGEVSQAVGQENHSAPESLNDFNPLRSGGLKLLRLRLVDTFGRSQDIVEPLEANAIITAETLPIQAETGAILLPPRLAQPARLNFRWLAAGEAQQPGEEEMNDHPATTPVCGWLLPNFLDSSLMVYDSRGRALGSLTAHGQWLHAPGRPPLAMDDLPRPHLYHLVNYLWQQGGDFLAPFLVTLERSLEAIDPETLSQHAGLALLVGRPLAVVRAALSLELKGRPAVHQGWNAFRQDVGHADMGHGQIDMDAQGISHPLRSTDGIAGVQFPIRVGNDHHLNDGLAGYWIETAAGDYRDNTFYAPQVAGDGEMPPHPLIALYGEDDHVPVRQSLADPPTHLTMLVDPRGVIHATSGILPAKAIQIPADQYAEALRAIEVTFLSAPILTRVTSLQLPLPDEPGFKWLWVARENGAWAETADIQPPPTEVTFDRLALREGWLKLHPQE